MNQFRKFRRARFDFPIGFLAVLSCHFCAAAAVDPFDQSRVPLEADNRDPKLTKIVLLAGGISSAAGQHEYFAGSALIMDWLKQSSNVWPVLAREGWPRNEQIFDGAKAIVVFTDGGPRHPLIEWAHWERLRQMMEEKIGLVVLHQAVDFPAAQAEPVRQWLGGVWLADTGCRGHWDMVLDPAADHPILRGVTSFPIKGDGWLYNLHFADSPKIIPLLTGKVPKNSRTTADAKSHDDRSEIMAWAFDRPNGGRSFAFTGCDLHKNWQIESQRRLVVNGILWSAGREIPLNGAPVKFDPGNLNRNLDKKNPPAQK